MEYKGWNEFEIGSVLFPFDNDDANNVNKHQEDRSYTNNSSYTASVAHWRVEKPIFNPEHCINCFNCWLYCPDSSIIARDEKLQGVDYVHCKGCGVCSSVCPTNPKSLLMYNDIEDEKSALASWPQKEKK
ncbi:4Fe-4S dicluster-binding protein [Helicobacter sp. MIT 14-3879]|uniref:4Fe-4S dicluster-binding protein n=1 Tax=Helicobacter sp. MIT 14-3879 TaxID=2040649 RepID=UPI000E1F7A23|nr:4Fe-4S dicluster-binding protein [Helicobacter sp. MIT 14-3879]RDU65146.1 pyruvate ferredoxin oxidoreductase [Helicobacter sp. MIT 14-3879]